MYKVVVIDEAYNDVRKIYNYIKNTFLSTMDAERVASRIVNSFDKLEDFPERHRLINGLSYTAHRYRMSIVKNYMIVFFIEGKIVNVVAVMYKRQNYLVILNNELPRRGK